MERLTKYESIGGHAHATPTGSIDAALMRLAAYEDTGYTPEEIEKLKGDFCSYGERKDVDNAT